MSDIQSDMILRSAAIELPLASDIPLCILDTNRGGDLRMYRVSFGCQHNEHYMLPRKSAGR